MPSFLLLVTAWLCKGLARRLRLVAAAATFKRNNKATAFVINIVMGFAFAADDETAC